MNRSAPDPTARATLPSRRLTRIALLSLLLAQLGLSGCALPPQQPAQPPQAERVTPQRALDLGLPPI